MPDAEFSTPPSADALWEQMVNGLIAEGHLVTPEICDAFRRRGRHLFVDLHDPGFQRIVAGVNNAYAIEYGQTISQPQMVAEMTEWLAPKPGEKALDVGLGSGWQAGLLQELVGVEGSVHAIERIEGLVLLARERFERLDLSRIQIVYGDGMNPDDVPQGPFDMITCAAGSVDAPQFWKDRLTNGGRLAFPKQVGKILDGKAIMDNGTSWDAAGHADGPLHKLCKLTRVGTDLREEFAEGLSRYVPLLPRTQNIAD